MMRISLAIVTFLTFAFFIITANAQIGYQVSLLDSATGEPRANETVSCTVTLSGQESTIFTGTQRVTSNEFGVLSLTVGNADMFNNVDWASELPLFVEVSVDGKSIGKSQVLSVPVAEVAKTIVPNKDIYGTWIYHYNPDKYTRITLHRNGTINRFQHEDWHGEIYDYDSSGSFVIIGDIVLAFISGGYDSGEGTSAYQFYYHDGKLYDYSREYTKE